MEKRRRSKLNQIFPLRIPGAKLKDFFPRNRERYERMPHWYEQKRIERMALRSMRDALGLMIRMAERMHEQMEQQAEAVYREAQRYQKNKRFDETVVQLRSARSER